MKKYILIAFLFLGGRGVLLGQLDHFLIGITSYDCDSSLKPYVDPRYIPQGTDENVGHDMEFLRQLKSYNFNFIHAMNQLIGHRKDLPIYYVSSTPSKAFLDRADSLGLKILLNCPELMVDTFRHLYNPLAGQTAVNYYGSHPALLGFCAKDEPSKIYFPTIATIFSTIARYNNTLLRYSNLNPMYADRVRYLGYPEIENHVEAYERYVEDFIITTHPNVLCFDSYPIWIGRQSMDSSYWPAYWPNDFFYTLDIISKKASQYDLPFIYQLTPNYNLYEKGAFLRMKNKGEFDYVINAALMYGAKGLQYWHSGIYYMSCWFDIEDQVKEYLKNLHAKLQSKEDILLSLTFRNAYHKTNASTVRPGYIDQIPPHSEWANLQNDPYALEIFDVGDPLVAPYGFSIDSVAISFLTDREENRYFWVFNKSMAADAVFKLNLIEGCHVLAIMEENRCPEPPNTMVELGPGEAKLYKACFVNDTLFVENNTVWNEERVITAPVVILPPAELTITHTVRMGKSASIEVRPGAKLLVDGGTLTALCEQEMWPGIYVAGKSDRRQSITNQGFLELKNNALVEYAQCAVSVWDGQDYSSSGGIVKAVGATLRNNTVGVNYMPYTNYDLYNRPLNNMGYFQNCRFDVNENMVSREGIPFLSHVILWGVDKVTFKGCNFINSGHSAPQTQNGRAIFAQDAGFIVDEYCTFYSSDECECVSHSEQSVFANFSTAIEINTTGNQYTFEIDHTHFHHNLTAIKVNGLQNFKIVRSSFTLPFASGAVKGIELKECNGFHIEENTFRGMEGRHSYPGLSMAGIYIRNAGYAENMIYRNYFFGLDYGIYVSGQNGDRMKYGSGLQFYCNTFDQNFNDIYMERDATVRPMQGDRSKGADNVFMTNYHQNLLNDNEAFGVKYFYNSDRLNTPSQFYGNLQLEANAEANGCASTLCNGQLSAPGGYDRVRTFSAVADSAVDDLFRYDQLREQYEALWQDYNHYGINWNEENSSSAFSLFSGYSSLSTDYGEILKSMLSSLSREMAAISRRSVYGILKDSVLVFDDLHEWYSRMETPSVKYNLVASYFHAGEYEEARDMLFSSPSLFGEEPDEWEEYHQYAEFHNLKERLRLSGINWRDITENELDELWAIRENSERLSGIMAQGVLCFFFNLCDEDLRIDEPLPRNLKREEKSNPELTVTIYPNPMDTKLNIVLQNSEMENPRLCLYDITGRHLQTEKLNPTLTTIPIQNLPQGVYFYRILEGDKVVAGDKIIKL